MEKRKNDKKKEEEGEKTGIQREDLKDGKKGDKYKKGLQEDRETEEHNRKGVEEGLVEEGGDDEKKNNMHEGVEVVEEGKEEEKGKVVLYDEEKDDNEEGMNVERNPLELEEVEKKMQEKIIKKQVTATKI